MVIINQLLNETFIRQRSEELRIPFENLLAAAVLEEIILKIAESDYAGNFWMKNSVRMNLENYRRKVDLNLYFMMVSTKQFHYKKTEVSRVFSELFRNYKKNAVHWNYQVWTDYEFIYIDVKAAIASVRVPVKIKLQPVLQDRLNAYEKEMRLFINNSKKVLVKCYPSEYTVSEKFLEIIVKLELLSDLSCYMDIYDILKKEALSGRKVCEILNEECGKKNIKIEEHRFELLMAYRTSSYMERKWKSFLRHEKKKEPLWKDVIDLFEQFFAVIWKNMCQNIIYLGDWMPEIGRYIDC